MLPPVDAVLSAEMIRDGGSLGAAFSGGGAEYWLFFPHRRQAGHVVGYSPPSIRERLGFTYEISWSHAVVFVHQLQHLTTDACHLHWLRAMELVAQASGALPDEPDRSRWWKT